MNCGRRTRSKKSSTSTYTVKAFPKKKKKKKRFLLNTLSPFSAGRMQTLDARERGGEGDPRLVCILCDKRRSTIIIELSSCLILQEHPFGVRSICYWERGLMGKITSKWVGELMLYLLWVLTTHFDTMLRALNLCLVMGSETSEVFKAERRSWLEARCSFLQRD